MSYRDFYLRKVKQDFNLTLVEGGRFLPPIESIAPSPLLAEFLAESIDLTEYLIPPVEQILEILAWMVRSQLN